MSCSSFLPCQHFVRAGFTDDKLCGSADKISDQSSFHQSDRTDTTFLMDDDENLSEDESASMECSVVDTPPDDSSIRHVRFSTVEIREYNLIIGDHPGCASYPLSLDWEHTLAMQIPVDKHTTRPCNRLHYMDRKKRIASVRGWSLQEITICEVQRKSENARVIDDDEWLSDDPRSAATNRKSALMNISYGPRNWPPHLADSFDLTTHVPRTRQRRSWDDSSSDSFDFECNEEFYGDDMDGLL